MSDDFFSGLDAAKAGLERQSSKALDALLVAVRELAGTLEPRVGLPMLGEAVRHLVNGERCVVGLRDHADYIQWSARNARGEDLPTPIPDVAERIRRPKIEVPVYLGSDSHGVRFVVLKLGRYGWIYVDGGERMRSSLTENELAVLGLVVQQLEVLLDNAAAFNQASQLGHRGISDRDYFTRRLREEGTRASRYGRPFSLAVITFDNSTALTSALRAGQLDRLSEIIAGRLRDAVREIDLMALLAPLRFALLLPETPRERTSTEVLNGMSERLYRTLDGARIDALSLVALEPRIVIVAHTSAGPVDTDEMLKEAERIADDRSRHPLSCVLR